MSYDFAFRVIDLTTMVATAQLKCPTYPTDVDESKQLRQIWSQTKKDASGMSLSIPIEDASIALGFHEKHIEKGRRRDAVRPPYNTEDST
jgi:hypothetical protein